MRHSKRLLLAIAAGAALTAPAWAQTASSGMTNTGTTQGTGSGGVQTSSNTDTFNQLVTVPLVSGITSTTSNSRVLSNANPFAAYYWSPQAMGVVGAATTAGQTGFGVQTFGTMTGGAGNRMSSAGTSSVGTSRGATSTTSANSASFGSQISGTGNTGLNGATGFGGGGGGNYSAGGGFGSNTGGRAGTAGGFGGGSMSLGGSRQGMMGGMNNNNNNVAATVVASSGLDIAYVSTVGNPSYSPAPFGSPRAVAGPAPRIQTELRVMFNASPVFADNKSIQVAATENGAVTLSGTVQSNDEKRLIEGMTRLTPGVRNLDSNKLVVKNGG